MMGGCFSSSDVEPSGRRKGDDADGQAMSKEFSGPVKRRSCTDIQYLVLFVAFVIIWIGLVSYCAMHANIFRLIRGYDDCGNVCGYITPNASDTALCTGANLTDKPYLQILPKENWSIQKKKCVSSCDDPQYKKYWNRCVPKGEESFKYFLLSKSNLQTFFQEAAEDIYNAYWEIVYLCLLALLLSILLVCLFRYFAGFLVWFVVIGVMVVTVCVSIYLWIVWRNKVNDVREKNEHEERNTTTNFVYAVIATIISIILALLIFGTRKSIKLVAQLFEEAGKAVQGMPCLLLQPFVAFCAIAALLVIWVNCYLLIESSGFPAIKPNTHRVHYAKNDVMKFSRWYNIVALFWYVQFVISCQHMVIAGAVATWFFTRNKDDLKSPITTSYSYLGKYHLGTVALGSFILALMAILRLIFKAIESGVKGAKNEVTKTLYKACSCCLYCLEKILVYLTRNAYIETAIYGDNLWKSGQRAFSVLTSNSMKVIAINSVGDFVLFLGEVAVVKGTVFVGFKVLEGKEGINHLAVPLVIVGIFAYIVVHSFMSAFEMVIDTIFICFCEDCELNDGVSKPYFMNKGLMEFVENSQKILRVGDATSGGRTE